MFISLIKYNLPKSHQISHEIPTSVYRMRCKCKILIFWFFILAFNFGYVYIINCVILKKINVFVSLIICPIVNNLINTSTKKKWKKYHGIQTKKCFFWKEAFYNWKRKDKLFNTFEASNQHNCCDFCPVEVSS